MNMGVPTLNNDAQFIVKTPVQHDECCFQNICNGNGPLNGGHFWWRLELYFQGLVFRISR